MLRSDTLDNLLRNLHFKFFDRPFTIRKKPYQTLYKLEEGQVELAFYNLVTDVVDYTAVIEMKRNKEEKKE